MSDIENLARALCKQSGEPPDHWEAFKEKASAVLTEISRLKEKMGAEISANESLDPIHAETEEYIDLCVGVSGWRNSQARWIVEDDYRVAGEVWRVHKGDADPYPSRPHAHCIDGAKRFIGCKLHLGTAELYKGSSPLGRLLNPKQFDRLIELIRPKFPGLLLPLTTASG